MELRKLELRFSTLSGINLAVIVVRLFLYTYFFLSAPLYLIVCIFLLILILRSSFSVCTLILWFCQDCCVFFITATLPHYFAAGAMDIAHNTTITLEYRGGFSYPIWYMDGSLVPLGPLYQFKLDPSTGGVLCILTINGNETSGILNVSCRLEGQTVYTERLTIEGL